VSALMGAVFDKSLFDEIKIAMDDKAARAAWVLILFCLMPT
jgi:hypothetical protein